MQPVASSVDRAVAPVQLSLLEDLKGMVINLIWPQNRYALLKSAILNYPIA